MALSCKYWPGKPPSRGKLLRLSNSKEEQRTRISQSVSSKCSWRKLKPLLCSHSPVPTVFSFIHLENINVRLWLSSTKRNIFSWERNIFLWVIVRSPVSVSGDAWWFTELLLPADSEFPHLEISHSARDARTESMSPTSGSHGKLNKEG